MVYGATACKTRGHMGMADTSLTMYIYRLIDTLRVLRMPCATKTHDPVTGSLALGDPVRLYLLRSM